MARTGDPATPEGVGPPTSIVIVNRGDPGIEATLVALEAYRGDAEVVVVDASAEALAEIRDRHGWVEWVDFVPTGPGRTIAAQRNEGARRASGDVVVYLDANCVPEAEWLERLVAPIARGDESIVAGRIRAKGDRSIHEVASLQGDAEATYLRACANMNVAFARSALEHVGGFDEGLGFAEDVDFAWRALEAGYRIRYEPAAVVAHDWGDDQVELRRAYRYGVGRARLYRKHPAHRRDLLGPERYVAVYAAYLVLSPVAIVAPWYLALLAIPMVRNARHRPVFTVAYQLCYAAGFLAEILGLGRAPG